MQLPPLTRDQVRRVDRVAMEQYGIPGIVLMENAGRGASQVIHDIAREGLVTILCGSGNNAGDGYVIARHLQLMGRPVRIVSVVDPESLSGDAGINAAIARRSRMEIRRAESVEQIEAGLADSATLIDALLGTGAKGAPRGIFADAVRAANQCDCLRVAIDLPTGLDCDTGLAHDPTFRADHTITFVSRKFGFDKNHADQSIGVVSEVEIGVPLCLLQEILTW